MNKNLLLFGQKFQRHYPFFLNFFIKKEKDQSLHEFIQKTNEEEIDSVKEFIDFLYRTGTCEPAKDTLREFLRSAPQKEVAKKISKIASKKEVLSDEEVIKMLYENDDIQTMFI